MTPSLAGLLVGRTLADRYTIEELIGRGGMSLVYRAVDQRLHRAVAVKVVSLPSASESQQRDLRERLRREAAAAARVPPHPNVVQVYDYGTDASLDLDFIAMELLAGRDLKQIMEEGPLSYAEAIRIVREAARGLSAGHRVGIVHRDVKPGNIVMAADGARTVKLLDFGIAKVLEAAQDDDLTRSGHAPHSPAWASPEQLRSGAAITPASDVYQLGLVAHALLSGERAEGGVISRGPRWQGVPEGVRTVIECALHSSPEERYRDAALFAEALSRAVDLREGTLLIEEEPAPRTPPPDVTVVEAPPPPAEATMVDPGVAPAAATASRRAGPRWGGGRIIALAAAALAALLLIRGIARDDPSPTDPSAPIGPEIEILDEQFRGLMEEAQRNLPEIEPATPPS